MLNFRTTLTYGLGLLRPHDLTFKETKMGCDIHLFSETKKDGAWHFDQQASVSVEEQGTDYEYIDVTDRPESDRDYWFFGYLADGVRTKWPWALTPQGFPEDLSETMAQLKTQWEDDGHNAGHLTVAQMQEEVSKLRHKRAEYLIAPPDNCEQWASAIDHHIAIMDKILGNLLEEDPLTAPEDRRIVFFFDN